MKCANHSMIQPNARITRTGKTMKVQTVKSMKQSERGVRNTVITFLNNGMETTHTSRQEKPVVRAAEERRYV